jgi:hypothetical protein
MGEQTRVACAVCGRPTDEPRSGLCEPCLERAGKQSEIAAGRCALCEVGDGRLLRPARLGDRVVCLCRNHAWLAERTIPRPSTVEELRALLLHPGDRRTSLERRSGERRGRDRRVLAADRRRGQRQPDKGDRRIADRRAR